MSSFAREGSLTPRVTAFTLIATFRSHHLKLKLVIVNKSISDFSHLSYIQAN